MAKDQAPVFANREHILSLPSLAQETMYIPEWKANIIVCEMSAGFFDQHRKTMMEIQRDGKASITIEQARARVVCACVRGEDGALLFNSGDVFKLAAMGNKVVSRIYAKIEELSTLTDEEAKEVAENLSEIGSGSTSSI